MKAYIENQKPAAEKRVSEEFKPGELVLEVRWARDDDHG